MGIHEYVRTPVLIAATVLLTATLVLPVQSQDSDLRSVHDAAVFSTVRIALGGGRGTGWLLRQSGRPLILTNRHVVPLARGQARVGYYQGSGRPMARGTARAVYVSDSIDLSILVPDDDLPSTVRALELETEDIVRGERIVLAGHPNDLLFQTSEGVVTGRLPEHDLTRRCGRSRNCVTVDAAAFQGSSGGPAVNRRGRVVRVVGMLWALPRLRDTRGAPLWVVNPTFAVLIHAHVLNEELNNVRRRLRRSR